MSDGAGASAGAGAAVEEAPDDLLDAELGAATLAVLDQVSQKLAAFEPPTLGRAGWASGTSGLMVANTYLEVSFPGRGHAERAEQALTYSYAKLKTGRMTPWLIDGAVGCAWALEHATEGDPEFNRLGDAHCMDVLAGRHGTPWELIAGMAGVGPYALERPAMHAGEMLARLGAVLAESVGTGGAGDEGAFWISPADANPFFPRPKPYVNYGVGHGSPGALLVLGALLEQGALAPEGAALVARCVSALLAVRQNVPGRRFRSTSDSDASARAAWCYGDPGVSWALLVAGRALGDAGVIGEALDMAEAAAFLPLPKTGVVDAGLCHGAAGLAHVFARMHRLHPERTRLREAACRWTKVTLDYFEPASTFGFRSIERDATGVKHVLDDPTTLCGAAGIALALLGVAGRAGTGWDRPLLAR